jgi:hypothetical protein
MNHRISETAKELARLRPKLKPSHGSNTDETRTKDEDFEQEQTEKTERVPNLCFLCYLLLVRPSFERKGRNEITEPQMHTD